MLSSDLTSLGEQVEAARLAPNGGVDFDGRETDLLLCVIYAAAEDAAALEAAQVGAPARGAVTPFSSPRRREAVKRLMGPAQAAHRAPCEGGDAA